MKKYEAIKKLAKNHGVTITQVENDLGFAKGSLSKIDRHTPSADRLAKLSDYFNVPLDYLFKDVIVEHIDTNDVINEYIYEVSAGNGRFNDGYEAVINNDDYSTVRICGDSMYPSLHDGDIVKVLHTKEVHPKDFAIVKIHGDESTCKHVELQTDGVWLRAENKDVFEDRFYNAKDVMTLPVTIIGIATEIVSRKL